MITQEMKEKGVMCKGNVFNCCNCKDKDKCVDYVNMDKKNKPPLGVISKDMWDARRIEDLGNAIDRYLFNGVEVPIEWIKEYNILISK